MKREFNKLYDIIIHSEDEEKMHILGTITKDMMYKLIDNYPTQAKEYIETLHAVLWCNYVTSKEAKKIVENMIPVPDWTYSTWEGIMNNLQLSLEESPYYNKCALYVTMCMISSDSGITIKSEIQDKNNIFKFIHKLALDKLKDQDHIFNIRSYFKL